MSRAALTALALLLVASAAGSADPPPLARVRVGNRTDLLLEIRVFEFVPAGPDTWEGSERGAVTLPPFGSAWATDGLSEERILGRGAGPGWYAVADHAERGTVWIREKSRRFDGQSGAFRGRLPRTWRPVIRTRDLIQ